jgi:hypothetical protein
MKNHDVPCIGCPAGMLCAGHSAEKKSYDFDYVYCKTCFQRYISFRSFWRDSKNVMRYGPYSRGALKMRVSDECPRAQHVIKCEVCNDAAIQLL